MRLRLLVPDSNRIDGVATIWIRDGESGQNRVEKEKPHPGEGVRL